MPDPSPTCGGIASRTSTSTPPLYPNACAGARRERGGALGLSPEGDHVGAGPGLDPDHHPRGLHRHAAAAEAARAEPGRIEHPEVQPRRRGDDDLGHVRSATYRRT